MADYKDDATCYCCGALWNEWCAKGCNSARRMAQAEGELWAARQGLESEECDVF